MEPLKKKKRKRERVREREREREFITVRTVRETRAMESERPRKIFIYKGRKFELGRILTVD